MCRGAEITDSNRVVSLGQNISNKGTELVEMMEHTHTNGHKVEHPKETLETKEILFSFSSCRSDLNSLEDEEDIYVFLLASSLIHGEISGKVERCIVMWPVKVILKNKEVKQSICISLISTKRKGSEKEEESIKKSPQWQGPGSISRS